jgi:adenosylhomocysteine nucleosidase
VATAGEPSFLVLVAVTFEARRLARALGGPVPPAWLETVGPGAPDLARLARRLAVPDLAGVIVTGLCGGCAPDLAAGDLVVGSPVGPTPAGGWLAPSEALVARAVRALEGPGLRYRIGRLDTTPTVVATPAAKAQLWRAGGTVAVDMESARVFAWAREAGIPAVAVRAVADGPDDPLPPPPLRAVGADGRLRPSAVLAWTTRPGLVRAAWQSWRRSRRGLDSLTRFLEAFLALRP